MGFIFLGLLNIRFSIAMPALGIATKILFVLHKKIEVKSPPLSFSESGTPKAY